MRQGDGDGNTDCFLKFGHLLFSFDSLTDHPHQSHTDGLIAFTDPVDDFCISLLTSNRVSRQYTPMVKGLSLTDNLLLTCRLPVCLYVKIVNVSSQNRMNLRLQNVLLSPLQRQMKT